MHRVDRFSEHKDFESAIGCCNKALEVIYELPGDSVAMHMHSGRVYHVMALTYTGFKSTLSANVASGMSQRHYGRALQVQQAALQAKQAELGADHLDVAGVLDKIAAIYKAQGHYDRALETYTRSLVIKKTELGDDHTSVGSTLRAMCAVNQMKLSTRPS